MDRKTSAVSWPPVILPNTHECVIRAVSNNTSYRVSIALPENPGTQPLPVIFALDAYMMFAGLVEAHRRGSRRPNVTGMQPAIIVGIDHVADGSEKSLLRWRDYTVGPSEDVANAPPPGAHVGGALAFHRFIEDELKPMLTEAFVIDAGRQTLCGHSLGGLFALWVLTHDTRAYDTYVALSPSLWWDGAGLTSRVAALGNSDVRVFIGVGEREGDASANADSRRTQRNMIGRARQFSEVLAAALPAEHVSFEVFRDEDHASVLSVGAVRCLRAAFRT